MSSETITRNDLTNILNEIVAIDGTDMTSQEIEDFVDSLNITSSKMFTTVSVATSSSSVGANSGVWKSATATIPDGYVPLCFKTFGVNHGWINITGQSLSSSGTTLTVSFFCQNITASAITCQCDAVVVLVNSSLIL